MCVPVIPACALKVCCYALDLPWLLRLSSHSLRPVLIFYRAAVARRTCLFSRRTTSQAIEPSLGSVCPCLTCFCQRLLLQLRPL